MLRLLGLDVSLENGELTARWWHKATDPRRIAELPRLKMTSVSDLEVCGYCVLLIRLPVGGLPSDGLEFGEAVKQLQTPGRPGSIIDELRSSQSNAELIGAGTHVRYYFIAGDISLLKVWEKWFITNTVMDEYRWRRMFCDQEGILRASREYGPCMEYIGQTSCTSPFRTVVRDMVNEFRDNVGQEGTDGIVTVNSQRDSTIDAKGRMTFHSTHLSITNNQEAYNMVMTYLTDGQVTKSGKE